MDMLNMRPQARRPSRSNLRVHSVNATILRSMSIGKLHLGSDDTDSQSRDLFSVFLGAVCQGHAPVKILCQIGEDVGFVETGTIAFLDLLF